MGSCTRKKLEKEKTKIELEINSLIESYRECIGELHKLQLINRKVKNRLLDANFAIAMYHEKLEQGRRIHTFYAHSKVKDENHELFSLKPIKTMELYDSKTYNERQNLITNVEQKINRHFIFEKAHSFEYHEVDRYRRINCEGCRPRKHDTEAKILENLSGMFKTGQVKSNGTLYMYTFFEPCLNCDYIIMQFMKKHLDIDLRIYYEQPYNSLDFRGGE